MTASSAPVRFPWRVLVMLAVPIVIMSCSIPVDDNVNQIDSDRLGNLANTTTTTTVPETLPETTLQPPESTDVAVTTTTQPATTTTSLVVQTTPVQIYYLLGNTDTIQELRREVSQASLEQVRRELEDPVPNLPSLGLQTAVRPGLIVGLALSRGTLDVALDRAVFDAMSDAQLRRAIAQIVLTFTRFSTPDAGAIAFVRLLYSDDGSGISVPLPETGEATEPGAALNFEDFRVLIDSSPSTATTTVALPPPTDPPPTAAPG